MLSTAASFFVVIAGAGSILLAAYVVFRSKTAEVIRGERDAWQEKCGRVEDDLKHCTAESHAKDVKIADLLAKTDLTVILANQTEGLKMGLKIEKSMDQMIHTLKAMEDRLNRGLIMK